MVAPLYPVCDALMVLLEPAGSSVVRDDAFAEPLIYNVAKATLFGWQSGMDDHRPSGPPTEEEHFQFSFAYVVPAAGELRAKKRGRTTSIALDQKAHDYLSIINANRSRSPAGVAHPWNHLRGSIDHDYLRPLRARGFLLVVAGWRQYPHS